MDKGLQTPAANHHMQATDGTRHHPELVRPHQRSSNKGVMKHFRQTDDVLIKTSLTKILESESFSRSERLRTFLSYVVTKEQEGLGHQLKGYTIGVDVFARAETFDPGGDPLVRVQAGKLRKLLDHYYTHEGKSDAIQIRIPVGSYVPVYHKQSAVEEEREASARAEVRTSEARTETRHAPARRGLRFAQVGLLTLTILNIAALGLHAASRYLVPGESIAAGTNGHSIYRDISAVPRIAVENRLKSSSVSAPFADMIRVAAGQLAAVELIGNFSAANAISNQDNKIDFTLSIEASDKPDSLSLALRHNRSGDVVYAQSYPTAELDSVTDRIYAANAFTGQTMQIAGHIYHFAAGKRYSSVLMRCMDFTYRYRMLKDRSTFLEAMECQRELVPHDAPFHFVTDLETLKSMARRWETEQASATGA